MPKREPKLQRWTDLLAVLLRYHFPATFEQLARDVPAYSAESKKKDAVMRMFERDKDELRSFGIAIETIPLEEEETTGYKLDRKTFYLPFLSLSASGGKPASILRKIGKLGYLATLVVEPDELSIIAAAAARVKALGDPVLAEDADSAMRKLAFDLSLPETPKYGEKAYALDGACMAGVSTVGDGARASAECLRDAERRTRPQKESELRLPHDGFGQRLATECRTVRSLLPSAEKQFPFRRRRLFPNSKAESRKRTRFTERVND